MYKNLLFLFSLLILSSCGSESEHEFFAFENSKGDWGYFDSDGEIVITPQFKSARPFKNGLARVEIEYDGKDKFAYINKKGEYDILKTWDQAMDFSDNLAVVRNDLGYPLVINTDLETVLEFPDASFVSSFSDGNAFKIIQYNDYVSIQIIDVDGNKVGEFEPGTNDEIVSTIENNLFALRGAFGDNDKDKSLIIMNSKGETISQLPENICRISAYNSEGIALIRTCDRKWGVIDDNGKIIINPQFDEIFSDDEDFIVRTGKKWGWIDSDGDFLINPQFRDVSNRGFNGSDLAAVKVGDKWGFINRKGKLQINPQFESVSSFFGDIALVYKRRSGHGIIDTDGKFVANPQFDEVYSGYYKKKIAGVTYSLDYDDFLLESDYLDVESIVKIMKSNINSTFYGLTPTNIKLSNFLEAKSKDSLIVFKSCNNNEGYMIDNISNYQDSYYKYDSDGYYLGRQDKGYYRINANGKTPTSGLYASNEKSSAVTNSFKVSFYDTNQTEDISCDDVLTLDYLSFSAKVWARNGSKKVYSSTNDIFSDFSRIKVNFKAKVYSSLNSKKRGVLRDRLEEEFSNNNYWNDELCFNYDFDISRRGDITMIFSKCKE